MLIKNKGRPLFAFTLAAVLLSLFFSATVFAGVETDDSRQLSLSVTFTASGEAAAGAQISIYKVADMSASAAGVVYTPLIGDYEYAGITAAESAQIAAQLAEMVSTPDASLVTDNEGRVTFSGLSQGMYLVIPESTYTASDGTQYVFDPYLACVPLGIEEENGVSWIYAVESTPKTASIAESTLPDEDDSGDEGAQGGASDEENAESDTSDEDNPDENNADSEASDESDPKEEEADSDSSDEESESRDVSSEDNSEGECADSDYTDSSSSPQTGDENSWMFWCLAAALAGCTCAAGFILFEKRNGSGMQDG